MARSKLLISIIFGLLSCNAFSQGMCPEIRDEIETYQKKELSLRDSENNTLAKLQKKYDHKIAEYTLLKGIKELKAEHNKFVNKMNSLNTGDEKTTIESVKDFISNLFSTKDPKLAALQEFRQEIRDGATATSGFILMESLLDELIKSSDSSGSLSKMFASDQGITFNSSAESFYESQKYSCEQNKNVFENSDLCKELFEKQEDGSLKEKEGSKPVKKILLGFYDTYKVWNKTRDDEDNQVKLKKSLEGFRDILLKNMPKTEALRDHLSQTQKLEEVVSKAFDDAKTARLTQAKSPDTSESAKIVEAQLTAFTNELDGSIVGDNLLGKGQREQFASDFNTAAIEGQFGNVSQLIDSLSEDIDSKKLEIEDKVLAEFKRINARKKLAESLDLKSGEDKSIDDIYKMVQGSLAKMGIEGCSGELKKANNSMDKDLMLKCLNSINKGSLAKLDKSLEDIKKELDGFKKQIKSIEKTDEYKNLNFMKNLAAARYSEKCGSKSESCRSDEQGIFDQNKELSLLKDSSDELLAILNPAQTIMDRHSNSVNSRVEKLCQDDYFKETSKTMCKEKRNFQLSKEVYQNNYITQGPDGFHIGEPRPSNTDLFLSALGSSKGIQTFPNFFSRIRMNEIGIGYAKNNAMLQKTQDYLFTGYYEKLAEAYEDGTLMPWGTSSSIYPTYYNPNSALNFQYGNAYSLFGGYSTSTTGTTYYDFSSN